MNNSQRVNIFDTTLRDGQQCPGAGMSFEKNIEYARLAAKLRVDVLEAGFPSASALDFEIVNTIAAECGQSTNAMIVAGLCQLRGEQVIKTMQALEPAVASGKARLHTYIPVDPALMTASLGDRAQEKKQIGKELYRLVKMAADGGFEVQFSPEGYSRMAENFDFVTELIRIAIEAGATIINCPDTIGGASVFEGDNYFIKHMSQHADIIAREYPTHPVTWSVHCHNDFGLAVQNTLNAVFSGPARQIEGCINGIGERAGNASLEQCIMLIKQFGNQQGASFETGIATEVIQEISDFTSRYMLPRQPHSPICGDNAIKHSSGGHTNAVLKNPMAYQPFDPRAIGRQVSMVFGPLSGGNHAKAIIESRGFMCNDAEKAAIAQFIKDRYSQRRKGITDDELMSAYFEYRQPFTVDRMDYSRQGDESEVHVHGTIDGQAVTMHAKHTGRDSALAALKQELEAMHGTFEIMSHRSYSEGSGTSAVSTSVITIATPDGDRFEGQDSDRDIEISAMKALVKATNRANIEKRYRIPTINNETMQAQLEGAA